MPKDIPHGNIKESICQKLVALLSLYCCLFSQHSAATRHCPSQIVGSSGVEMSMGKGDMTPAILLDLGCRASPCTLRGTLKSFKVLYVLLFTL